MLLFIIAVLLSISIVIESVGAWFRYVGAKNYEPTNGYSTHVRIATASRFFIVIAAPLIGHAVDAGRKSSELSIIGVLVFFISTCILYVYRHPNWTIINTYNALNPKSDKKLDLSERPSNEIELKISLFHIASIISFVFTASGVLVVNILAAQTPEFRATILQMSAFITMFGTLIHTFYVDPELARAADEDSLKTYSLVNKFIIGRTVGSFILMLIFTLYFVYAS